MLHINVIKWAGTDVQSLHTVQLKCNLMPMGETHTVSHRKLNVYV